jgi:hypothetical protein
MVSGIRRLRALWRAFLAADAPLHRRAWGLCLALLPLAPRRWLLRLSAFSPPRWLVRGLSDLGGYLIMAMGAVLALWLWGRLDAALCASLSGLACAPRNLPIP